MLHNLTNKSRGRAAEQSGAPVLIANVQKRYGQMAAVDGVDLEVEPGEFVAILGPSGSGKTTLLMAIAGFVQIDSGDILIDNQSISGLPPDQRNIGVVFQRYALFPHLTVFENVAFPLKQRGIGKAERTAKVAEALERVRLQGLADRYPSDLSGGQQQRVAIARAIVFSPRLLLMDEPLGALDRRLREDMQLELKMLQQSLGMTVLLVTHDQEEAMSLADRVAVMSGGRIQQVGTPLDVYDRPKTDFVANFIGETNRLPGVVLDRTHDDVTVKLEGMPNDIVVGAGEVPSDIQSGGSIDIFIRPEAICVSEPPDVRATVKAAAFLGSSELLVVEHQQTELKIRRLRRPGEPGCAPGDVVPIRFPRNDLVIFPAER